MAYDARAPGENDPGGWGGRRGGGRGDGAKRAGKERRGIGRGKVQDEGERRRSSMDASVAVLSGATGSQSNG